MQTTIYHAFVYGLAGSAAVELVLVYQAIGPGGGLIRKYKSWFFWTTRGILAVLSGLIATAYFAPQLPAFLYVHIGAATPAILTKASRVSDDAEEDSERFS